MGGMHFGHLEAGLQGTPGGSDKGLDDVSDLRFGQFGRCGVLRVEGNLRGPHRHPATIVHLDAAMLAQPGPMGAGLAPGMGQLDAWHRALGGDETGDALQRRDLRVVPQAQVLRGNAPIGSHGSGFGENQAGATHRAAAQVHQVPVIGQAVDTGILAHG
ncbi:hypothetical protein D3C79_660900 [compost metagenome]